MLELDHIFCLVENLDDPVVRLERQGWALDAGSVHRGQGTRNRRLVWPEHYLELLWIADPAEARANRLRLDRRGDWASTGASPFGVALRGLLPDRCRDDFWLYDELGLRIWVHDDNERDPERPMVLILETGDDAMERRRPRSRTGRSVGHGRPAPLREVRVRGPAAASVPTFNGPQIVHTRGPHHLELVVGGGSAHPITQILTIRS